MAIETVLRKRRAKFPNEVGFFADNEMAAEDISTVAIDTEVMCKFTSPKNLQLQKYLWALVQKVHENTDRFVSKDHAMEQLKLRVRFAKLLTNDDGDLELVAKSIKRISNEELTRLTDQIIHVVCTELMPGMKPNELRREIEKMVS